MGKSVNFPGGSVLKNLPFQCRRCRFHPWAGKVPWRRKWKPTPAFLPGKYHGQRFLAGSSRGGLRESGMTYWLNNNNAQRVFKIVWLIQTELSVELFLFMCLITNINISYYKGKMISLRYISLLGSPSCFSYIILICI